MKNKTARWVIVILVICLVVGLAVGLLLRGKNELSQASKVEEVPCDGVSMEVIATKRDVEIVVKNTGAMNYIVWEPDQIELEMLVDGTWFVVSQEYTYPGATEMLAPADEICTLNYRWKDIYPADLERGQYRMVLTFWVMSTNEEGTLVQSENYVLTEEFEIK